MKLVFFQRHKGIKMCVSIMSSGFPWSFLPPSFLTLPVPFLHLSPKIFFLHLRNSRKWRQKTHYISEKTRKNNVRIIVTDGVFLSTVEASCMRKGMWETFHCFQGRSGNRKPCKQKTSLLIKTKTSQEKNSERPQFSLSSLLTLQL